MKKRLYMILTVAAGAMLACGILAGCSSKESACAKGHTWADTQVVTAATCESGGSVLQTCTVCGATQTVETAPAGHQYAVATTIEPTCTTDGVIRSVCSVCGDMRQQTLEKLGHQTRKIAGVAPTCTADGYTDETVCDRCNEVIEAKTVLPKTAHTYERGVCSACGAEKQLTAKFLAGNDTVKEISFTVSTKDAVLAQAPAVPARDGYENGRWEEYSIGWEDVTIHAIYDIVHYTITYQDSKNAPNQNPAEYTVEQAVEFTSPELTGYKFEGWYSDGEKIDRIPVGTMGNYTLEARWSPVRYSITYEGVDPKAFDLPEEYTVEQAVALPANIEVRGRTFLGWEADGQAILSIPRGSYGDKTIHATFDVIRYTITYQDDKHAPNQNPAEYTVEQAVEFTSPELIGYKFEGWYSGGEKIERIPAGTIGNYTLEARWSLVRYSITYEGVDPDALGLPAEYTIESEVALPEDLGEKGREFLGWEANGRTVNSIPRGSHGDVTLRARFKAVTFRVTLDAAGGNAAKAFVYVGYAEKYNLPVPEREGYDFLGWYTNSGASGTPCTDAEGASLGTYLQYSDKVFYAHWASKTLLVTYDSQGGEPVAEKTYRYGDPFIPAETDNENGYLLDGWFNADGTVKYTEATPVTENMTVYAHWIESIPVSTKEGLLAIAQNPSANYHLTRDINLGGIVWTPIEEFSGILNGNGYSIISIILNCTGDAEKFGFILTNRGRIENLTMKDVIYSVALNEPQQGMNGGIFAAVNEGSICGCKVEVGSFHVSFYRHAEGGSITFNLNYGEIAGYNAEGALIENCRTGIDIVASIDVRGSGDNSHSKDMRLYIGGIVGNNAGTTTNCECSAKIDSTNIASGYSTHWGSGHEVGIARPYIGGIAGFTDGVGKITKCYATVGITIVSTSQAVEGQIYTHAGGICGELSGKESSIDSCYSYGTISGGGYNQTYFGGLVGYVLAEAMLTSSYSHVSISANIVGEYGGLVGRNEAIVRNCYATGNVSCTSTDANTCLGGFVGHGSASSNISMCYSTGNVSAKGGNTGYFIGLNDLGGSVYKVYYLSGATVELNGTVLNQVTEFGVASKQLGELWSEEFLVSELYWDAEGWIILFDEDPILDWETSVSHSYETYVVEPTCEDFGYTVYVCRDCNRIFVRGYTVPLGHDYDYDDPVVHDRTCEDDGHTYYRCRNEEEDILHDSGLVDPAQGHIKGKIEEQQDATCTEEGFVRYLCTVCGEEVIETIAPKGHTLPATGDDGNATEGSCSKDGDVVMGHTARVTCTVCHEVIRESEDVSPHKYTVVEEGSSKATCLTDGKEIRKCVICGHVEEIVLPATGHTVLEGTARCVVCQQFVIDEKQIVEIKNVQDLKNITLNPAGIYMLKANIDLQGEDWIPLGTEQSPFTGWLFGNGFKISNLTVTGKKYGGLFAFNEGRLVGLTVENATLIAENVGGATLGTFAAVNRGSILNCTLEGDVFLKLSIARVVDDFNAHFEDYAGYAGGFAGENASRGEISKCNMDASIVFTLTHSMQNTAQVDWRYYVLKMWKRDYAISLASFYAGGIAGINRGVIASCGALGSTYVQNVQKLDIRHSGTLPTLLGEKQYFYNAGFGTLTTDIYAGSLAGYNVNTVRESSARRIAFEQADGVTSSEGLLFGMTMEMKTQWGMDNGYGALVGANATEGICDNLVVY